jgi:arylsulfatase A-like enzyme
METLRATGQADNTLIVVTSDNGAVPGDFRLDEQGHRLYSDNGSNEYAYECYDHQSNGPLRGYKAHIWDGGHRIPFLAYWPNRISPGTVRDDLFCLTDLMATFASITGTEISTSDAEDSFDLSDVLLGQDNVAGRDHLIYHSSEGVFSIRQGQWKLIHECPNSGGWPPPRGTGPQSGVPGQLYDIVNDPYETTNLWASKPDVVKHLADLLDQYRGTDRRRPV